MVPISDILEKGKNIQTVKRSVAVRGRGGKNRQHQGLQDPAEAILYGTVIVDTHHCTFVQT